MIHDELKEAFSSAQSVVTGKQDGNIMSGFKDIELYGKTYRAQVYRVIGTKVWCAKAYEPSAYMGAHASVCTFDGDKVWGDIVSRRIPDGALAGASQEERSNMVHAHYMKQDALSRRIINTAFPTTVTWQNGNWLGQLEACDA